MGFYYFIERFQRKLRQRRLPFHLAPRHQRPDDLMRRAKRDPLGHEIFRERSRIQKPALQRRLDVLLHVLRRRNDRRRHGQARADRVVSAEDDALVLLEVAVVADR